MSTLANELTASHQRAREVEAHANRTVAEIRQTYNRSLELRLEARRNRHRIQVMERLFFNLHPELAPPVVIVQDVPLIPNPAPSPPPPSHSLIDLDSLSSTPPFPTTPLDTPPVCDFCLDSDRLVVFLPCNHCIACEPCFNRIHTTPIIENNRVVRRVTLCPTCRAEIAAISFEYINTSL